MCDRVCDRVSDCVFVLLCVCVSIWPFSCGSPLLCLEQPPPDEDCCSIHTLQLLLKTLTTLRLTVFFPPLRIRKRFLKLCVSWSITALMLAVAFFVMICSLNLQGYVRRVDSILHIPAFHRFAQPGAVFDPESMLAFLPGIMHAISIMTLNNLYRMIATQLCQWENHETNEDFEASLLKKRFAFEAFDCYVALFYLAFWECDANLVRPWCTTHRCSSTGLDLMKLTDVPRYVVVIAARSAAS